MSLRHLPPARMRPAIGSLSPSGALTALKSHIRPSVPGIQPCRPPSPISSTGAPPRAGQRSGGRLGRQRRVGAAEPPCLVEQRLCEIDCCARTSAPHEGRVAPPFPHLVGDVIDRSESGGW